MAENSIRAAWKNLKQRYRLGVGSRLRARHACILYHLITPHAIESVASGGCDDLGHRAWSRRPEGDERVSPPNLTPNLTPWLQPYVSS